MRRDNWRTRSTESSSGVGWLYADPFLALMLVGFGSSVVVRHAIPSASASPSPAAANAVLSCNEFAVPLAAQLADATDDALRTFITTAIDDEIERRGWELSSARVAFVIVVGGFELYEGAGDGDVNARAMRARIRKIVPALATAEMRTAGARSTTLNDARLPVGNNGDYVLVMYLLHSNNAEMSCL